MEQYDTLLHLSSETETVFRSISNFFIYFLLWTGGKRENLQPTYMSMNRLVAVDVYDSGVAKLPMGNIHHPIVPEDFTNYRPQYLQGYWEVKGEEDYMAVSLKSAYPISKTSKLQGLNGNWCYLTKYRRYSDSKEFYYIQLTQTHGGYLHQNAYKALSDLMLYIKHHFPGLYIITGDFNVQGHEKIFEYHLGAKDYHICPYYKLVTCNDNEGLASPDGIVVSRELYPRVEYAVDFYTGYSYQHYILTAKLFAETKAPGTFDVTSPGFKNFLYLLDEQNTNRTSLIGYDGEFDPTNEEMLGSMDNVEEVQIDEGGPWTYTATEMANKLNKIKTDL